MSLRPMRVRGDREERVLTLTFLIPALLVTFGIILIPLTEALWMSFHRYTLTIPGRPFIGLDNYTTALADPTFWQAMGRTLYFTLVSTGLELGLGMLVALLLNEQFAGRGLLRGIMLIPWALPTMVNGMMWRWIDHPDYGALNALLTQLGLIDKYQAWTTTPRLSQTQPSGRPWDGPCTSPWFPPAWNWAWVCWSHCC
ncbi:MAG: sugar ABC transporter permease, partial [Firmicutes bacterium]|nr:sugar ABC transporter permease [Bacillota bacterium]